jgi:hypothetical protein
LERWSSVPLRARRPSGRTAGHDDVGHGVHLVELGAVELGDLEGEAAVGEDLRADGARGEVHRHRGDGAAAEVGAADAQVDDGEESGDPARVLAQQLERHVHH